MSGENQEEALDDMNWLVRKLEGMQWKEGGRWVDQDQHAELTSIARAALVALYTGEPDRVHRYMPSWNHVDDRLPESENRIVLGFMPRFPGGEMCSHTMTMRDERWQYVTHWMPLPPPPHGV